MIFPVDDPARRNSVALIDGGARRSHTYGELADQVSRYREALVAREKSLVFLFCRNDLCSIAWYLAAIESGNAVALLKDDLNPQLRDNLLALYQPEWVISAVIDPDLYGESNVDGLWRRRRRDSGPIHSELALLLSTSGSTGSPKFVRLTRRNIEANAASIAQELGIVSTDVPVAHLPIHYSYGLSVLNSHLLVGAATLLVGGGLVTPAFWEAIRAYSANSFSGVPYTYQTLRRLGLTNVHVPSLKKMTQAGGNLDAASVAFFHKCMMDRQGEFWVMYGQTEATARISTLHWKETNRKLGSVGRPIPGGILQIVTDAGEAVTAPDTEGELVYIGPNVMLGYASHRADLAKGDELQGRLYTGDRARIDSDGFLYILGRSNRDAKVFGLRINLDELETFVKAHGPAAAVGAPDRVIIFCEFGTESSHRAICDALSGMLQIHRSAFEFRRVEHLPTKDSGKIDYQDLLQRI